MANYKNMYQRSAMTALAAALLAAGCATAPTNTIDSKVDSPNKGTYVRNFRIGDQEFKATFPNEKNFGFDVTYDKNPKPYRSRR